MTMLEEFRSQEPHLWNCDVPSSAEKKNSKFMMRSPTLIKQISPLKIQPNLEDDILFRGRSVIAQKLKKNYSNLKTSKFIFKI